MGNWIIGGNLAGSEVGGGACIDFQSNSGASSGGNNYIFYPQCDFFPLSIHLFDQNGDRFFLHTENTDSNAVVGSPNSGTAVLVDGTATTTCIDNEISNSSVTSFAQGVYITANCAHTVVTSPSYSGVATHITDLGTNSQTVGAAPDVQNVTFSGAGNSVVEYFLVSSSGVSAGDIVCFSTSALTVIKCPASSSNPLGVAIATVAASAGAVVGVQFSGLANVTILPLHSLSPGQFVCLLTANTGYGTVQPSTSPCSVGQQIGIVAQTSGGSVGTAQIFLQKS